MFTIYLIFGFCKILSQDIDSTSTEQIDSYISKSEVLQQNGQTDNALKWVDAALDLCVKTEKWEKYISISLDAVNMLDGISNLKSKRRYLDNSIQLAERKGLIGHKLLVKSLRLKGEYFIESNQLDSAKIILDKSIKIGTEFKHWEELAWSLVVQSVVNYYIQDFPNMEVCLEKVQEIVDSEIDDKDIYYETITQLQSILYTETGDAQKAMEASQKSLNRFQNRSTYSRNDSIELANAYNTHGSIFSERGDYEQAIHHYKIALALHQKIKGTTELNQVNVGNNLSLAYKKQTDWKFAEYYLNICQSLLPNQPNKDIYKEWIQIHQLLAANNIDQEKYKEAIQLLEVVLPESEKYDYYQEWVYGSFGRAMTKTGKPQIAINYLSKAIQQLKTSYGDNNANVALMTMHLGEAYIEQDSLDLALQEFQNALEALTYSNDPISEKSGNPNINEVNSLIVLLPILAHKGRVLLLLSKDDPALLSSALSTYRDATKVIDALRSQNESAEAKLLLSSNAKEIYETLIQILFEKHQEEQNESLVQEAFLYFEKSKALLLQENIQSASIIKDFVDRQENDTTSFIRLIQEGRSIKNEILFFESKLKKAQQSNNASDSLKIKNTEEAIANIYQAKNYWESKIEFNFPAYHEIQRDSLIIKINDLRKRLIGEESALIEYFVGSQKVYAIIITPLSSHFIQLGDTERIFQLIQDFEKLLSQHSEMSIDAKKAFASYNKGALNLHNAILKEALDKLPANIQSLIIIPDTYLTSIPFEALNTKVVNIQSKDFSKLPFLLYDYKIQYGYSANTLIINKNQFEQLESNTKCLAFAPIYNSNQEVEKENNLVNLKGTSNEIRGISKYFSGEFEGSQNATEAKFKQKSERFGIIHLASHGVADFDNPEFAHLKFSDHTSDTLNDNLLHHHEIVDMNLNCQMAVLSACETGLGKYKNGEGVFSLARGFMLAGVPSVVMSLWQINDKSTSQLIPNYYKYLSKGSPKHQSLQKAKIEYLQNAGLKYKHPYYWSGMVLLGNEQALKQSMSISNWNIYIGIFSFFVLLVFVFQKKLIQLFK